MWDSVDTDRPLSQGDLLLGVEFLVARLPLDDVPTRRHGNRGEALVGWIERPAIVITQCCEIDKPQTRHLSLAPVQPSPKLSPELAVALERTEPPADGAGYVYDAFPLDPYKDAIVVHPGTVMVADLKQASCFAKTEDEFKARRCAAMTVHARRLLRIRLSLFYGRPTPEDEVALVEAGLPPGLTPPEG